jgi:hypothetical protein
MLKRVERPGRIDAWTSPNELDHLLELGGAKFGHDLVDASLMHEQNCRDDVFGHILSGGPSDII